MSGIREAVIDSTAISANVEAIIRATGVRSTMSVVKADGYGHGAITAARAALAGGAEWLGVADIDEGLQLREAGIDAPILAWLHDPGSDFDTAVEARLDVGVSTLDQLEAVAAVPGRARVQLKVETGLNRNGLAPEEWELAASRASELQRAGRIEVRGVFSHLANTDAESDASAGRAFEDALAVVEAAGIEIPLRHLASTGGALARPDLRYDLVRIGIGTYGLSPFGAAGAQKGAAAVELRPAMTLRSRIAAIRIAHPGDGVSYDHTWTTDTATRLALVPIGYADGVPRAASGRGEVCVGERRFPIRGRVAMDQFVIEIGDAPVRIGDDVVLFGDPSTGVPSADDWAAWSDTINYEIVTRIGPRVRRVA